MANLKHVQTRPSPVRPTLQVDGVSLDPIVSALERASAAFSGLDGHATDRALYEALVSLSECMIHHRRALHGGGARWEAEHLLAQLEKTLDEKGLTGGAW